MNVEEWDALKELGLTDNEVNAYLALLETGATTAGLLVEKTGLHRSRVYASLERLLKKGFATVVLKGQRHYYEALPPEALVNILDERKRKIQELLPQLAALQPSARLTAGMYEGMRGMKAIREKLLSEMRPGETLLVQGAPRIGNLRLEAWFLDFHKRREKKGVGIKILYNADAREFGEKRKRFRLTQVRYMKEPTTTPMWIDIFRDSVLMVAMAKNVVSFWLRDKQARDSFAAYFDILWKNAARS